MSACNNLKQYGIPYSLTKLHTEAPDSPEFAKDLEWFARRVPRGARILNNLAHRRHRRAPDRVQYRALQREDFGSPAASPSRRSTCQRSARPHRTNEGQRRRRRGQAGCDQEVRRPPAQCPTRRLMKMAKLGALSISGWKPGRRGDQRGAVLDIARRKSGRRPLHRHEHDERQPAFPALAKSTSAAFSACTCLAAGFRNASALLDWNNNYGTDPNKAVCFHCSNLPKHFFREVRWTSRKSSLARSARKILLAPASGSSSLKR